MKLGEMSTEEAQQVYIDTCKVGDAATLVA